MSKIVRSLISAAVMCGLVLIVAVVADHPVRAHDAKHFSAGEPGNPKRPSRVVVVTMTEENGKMLFKPDRIVVRQGEQIRFVLSNAGHLDHEFMIATPEENRKHADLMMKYPDMEHDDPNGRTVKTRQKGELLWRFTRRGQFEFACLIPGHYQAGMYGTIVVK